LSIHIIFFFSPRRRLFGCLRQKWVPGHRWHTTSFEYIW